MNYRPGCWDQLRNITKDELVRALDRDGWSCGHTGSSIRIYEKGAARVSVHYHSGATMGSKLLKGLLDDIGWTEDDLVRLKLIKR